MSSDVPLKNIPYKATRVVSTALRQNIMPVDLVKAEPVVDVQPPKCLCLYHFIWTSNERCHGKIKR